MVVANAARDSTGGVDEQSMSGLKCCQGSAGGVDEQSMVVPRCCQGQRGRSR